MTHYPPHHHFPRLDQEKARQEILAYLAGLAPMHTATRAKIHSDLYGDAFVLGSVINALRFLRVSRLVELTGGRGRDERYRINDAGRAALDLDDALRDAS